MDAAHRGEAALKAGNPKEALGHYNDAITSVTNSPVYYIGRSTAHQRLSQRAEALADAELAVVAAMKRGKRELIGESQLRRAISLFFLDRFGDSGFCLQLAAKYNGANKSALSMWEAKVKQKTKDIAEGDEKLMVTVTENPDIALPNVQAEAKNTTKESEEKPQATNTTAAPAAPSAEGCITPAGSIRHEYYQNNENVVVTLFAKSVPKEKATVEVQERAVNVSFPLASGSTYDFSLDPLFASVKSGAATHRILSTKIEITLPKATPGQKWSSLEAAPGPDAAPSTTSLPIISADAGLPDPYSSKKGPRDWDKVAKSYERPLAKGDEDKENRKKAEEEADVYIQEDDDEGDPTNFFFKKLFKGATDEQKKAMMKSYQESGGTSLSTNWDEVKKGPVPVSPPDGMEAKKWEH